MRVLISLIFVLLVLFFVADVAFAQCAMCKQNVTSSEEGMKYAESLNAGILYLLTIPYLIFAGFAITIFLKLRKRAKGKKSIGLN